MISNQKDLIIIGGGGHANSVYEIAKSLNYNILGFLDDYKNSPLVLGNMNQIAHYTDCLIAIGIGGIKNLKERYALIQNLHPYFSKFINLISPYALTSSNLIIGKGNTIHPFTFINSNVKIGDFCIINTRATIEHDCQIGDNVHISTGAILNGEVKIHNHVFIGSGTIVKNKVEITENVIIGMGSVVLNNINEPGIYVGNPLKKIKTFNE